MVSYSSFFFNGTNDSLKGKICGTGDMLAELKGPFFFLLRHAEAQTWLLELSVRE